jgi:hypothetical protein
MKWQVFFCSLMVPTRFTLHCAYTNGQDLPMLVINERATSSELPLIRILQAKVRLVIHIRKLYLCSNQTISYNPIFLITVILCNRCNNRCRYNSNRCRYNFNNILFNRWFNSILCSKSFRKRFHKKSVPYNNKLKN